MECFILYKEVVEIGQCTVGVFSTMENLIGGVEAALSLDDEAALEEFFATSMSMDQIPGNNSDLQFIINDEGEIETEPYQYAEGNN